MKTNDMSDLTKLKKCHFNCGDSTIEQHLCECYSDWLRENKDVPPFFANHDDSGFWCVMERTITRPHGKLLFTLAGEFKGNESDVVHRIVNLLNIGQTKMLWESRREKALNRKSDNQHTKP